MKTQQDFVKANDSKLRRFLRKKGLSAADAEDAAQDSWVAFLTSAARFEGRSSPATYLFGIGKNKARETKRLPMHGELPDSLASRHSPETDLGTVEGVQKIQTCIDELPSAQKTVLTERAFEERDVSSIAKKLRMTANNVSVLLHRARTYLTSCIHEP